VGYDNSDRGENDELIQFMVGIGSAAAESAFVVIDWGSELPRY
jgi:hypothetical protein